jgi:hypothetical protein
MEILNLLHYSDLLDTLEHADPSTARLIGDCRSGGC